MDSQGLKYLRDKQETSRKNNATKFGRHPHKYFHLILPLPHKYLSPNARCHWAPKAMAAKAYRTLGKIFSMEGECHRWKKATSRLVFYHKTRHGRDADNLLASMKSAFDGIADAGVVANDVGLIHLPVERLIDKENPRVEIFIEPEEQADE